SLPDELESQLNELSNQKDESLETIIVRAISYYFLVYENLIKDFGNQKRLSNQRQLAEIDRLRGSFKGCLSSSDDFANRKKLEKELEL
ncbi:hypothetical protein L0Z72_16625, partial [candidate division KSB1 bacterium]|nr:hypothetical protein [candidate division KSB1 bacterium]